VVGDGQQTLCLTRGWLAYVDYDQAVRSAGVIQQPLERTRGQRARIARLGGGDQPQPRRLGERPLGGTLLVDGPGELSEPERRVDPYDGGEPAAGELREQHRDGAVASGAAREQVGERAGAGAAGEAADGDERTTGPVEGQKLALRRSRRAPAAEEREAARQGCGCHSLTPHPCAVCSRMAM
jgi:hypothetical protein